MDRNDLTPEQAAKLLAKLEPMRAYLAKLTGRMQRRAFAIDDPLCQRAIAADRAILALVAELRPLAKPGKPKARS
jgi:hypothetical protein